MKYYCIGIKGAGMSTLAEILSDLGNTVIGYDDNKNHVFTEEGLEKRNIKIYYDQTHDLDKDMIVTYSAAFKDTHPEISRIKNQGLKIVSYNELLGSITNMFETTCISGTHGKTTTSLLISHILKNTIGTNYFVGDGSGYANKENKTFIIESCEYNKHFLAYHPYNTVITNIELEHVECYDGIEDIINTFSEFANKSTNMVVACGDNENVRKLKTNKPIIYYGFNINNDMYATNVVLDENGSKFDVYYHNKFYGSFDIPLFGKHMVLNTLAAIIICDSYGISKDEIHKYLESFVSPKRRFKETFIKNNVIIDDYAHHPTEIKVTLEAARQKYPNKELVAVFKPNTYTRTRALYKDFITALNVADKAYVTDIYCDREKKEDYPEITSDLILNGLNSGEHINEDEVSKLLVHNNAVIVFMSCKNIYIMKDEYEKLLNK